MEGNPRGKQELLGEGRIPSSVNLEIAIECLRRCFRLSSGRATSVGINLSVPEGRLEDLFNVFKDGTMTGTVTRVLHITQQSSLNAKTREFARVHLPCLEVLSTTNFEFEGHQPPEGPDINEFKDLEIISSPVDLSLGSSIGWIIR